MSSRAFVAVLGPPASGKTTVTSALCDRAGGAVFRLREFAYDHALRCGVDHRTWLDDTAVEWLREDAVERVFEAALESELRGQPLIWLENFPGTARQVRLVHTTAAAAHADLVLVNLVASDDVLWRRARSRRVCSRCEPDVRGEPHRPAREDPVRRGCCERCGATLAVRRGDDPARFAERLTSWRARSAAIHREARALGIPWGAVDAAVTTSDCVERAWRVLSDLSRRGIPVASPTEEVVRR